MENYVHDLKQKLDKRFTLTVFDNENVIEKFKESLINKYERDMQTFITQNIPAYITPQTNAVLYSTAVERHYAEYCRDLLYADPETGDIDDINGYLRDARMFNEQAQMARNGLRLDLTRADTKNAPSSAVVQEFLQREKALEEEYKTDVPETERVLKKYVFETEHVLEVSVVAHMINNQKFKAAVENHLGRHYMETGSFSAMDTLAALAVTLKQQQNLVGKVPDDFNGHKGRFFQGK
ncbi:hypothetical protein H0H81_000787 [Sphagnurus paluster]|uniref:Uncharacterized protein n=1 Tax=Sphagnurus paluster TaxID=117069 RepID=A0A9P7KH01_9AGAR|nr:hypothetical protein H0H81_000787 [Sphagnurus paluster]